MESNVAASLELSPASESDLDFVYRVTEAAMRGYVEKTWGIWEPRLQRKTVYDSFNTQTQRIISRSGERIGILASSSHNAHAQLEKIYLLPAHQNQGIGSTLIRQLMQHASLQRKPLRLRVLRVNPARRLYDRLGFVATFTTLERIYMEYRDNERVSASALVVRAQEDS